jgi:hypothetical protein
VTHRRQPRGTRRFAKSRLASLARAERPGCPGRRR